jgi:Tol biopolymer transport system component/aminoglycoside phosphotransferase (APT) family kinase protein
MTMEPGTRLGPYTVTARLGQGGMGEVYRATDARLNREVAIKVLPPAFTQDHERLARFEREAQVLAQLHHPNISSIFGLEEAGGVRALVMELVEGPTLAERLERGPMPLEDALTAARQIAEALEEAHEKGIVHRDLKPANVKLAPDGRVKVLDFGLAKALDTSVASESSPSQLTMSPTLVRGGNTQMGAILGTAAYMAPEQAVGGTVDRRADIWAFGVVLYEMLTARRLFDGETVSHVLASVLKDAPDYGAIPPGTPERVVDLVRRCLRRKPRERLQSIGDARLLIEEVLADPDAGAVAAVAARAPAQGAWLAWGVAAAGLLAAMLFLILWLKGGPSAGAARMLHAALTPPGAWAFGDTFALSPDGRRLVFEAWDVGTGERALFLRPLDRGEATRLQPAAMGEMPFWSPDGMHIGFFADGKLKRLDLRGGPAQAICDAPTPRGGAWGEDGRIVFAGAFRAGLSIVPAGGGEPAGLTTLDTSRNEKSHRFPVFVPGGRTVIFLAQTAEAGARNDRSAIEALDLATGRRSSLVAANSSPVLAGDWLLFWRDGALLATAFDKGRVALHGDPRPVASPVAFTQNEQVLASALADGTLVYRAGSRGTYSSLVLADRTGVALRVVRDRELMTDFRLSHDGKRLAYSVNTSGQGSTDIWVHDFDRGSFSRLTFEEGGEGNPVWSADDRHLYYTNDRRNDGVVFRRPTDGSGAPEEIGTSDQGFWALDASADGRWVVIGGVGDKTANDLFRLDLSTRSLAPLVATPSNDEQPALSPDDALLAFASEQSGRWEIYVQALGGGKGSWQISTEGGVWPRWRADGRELFFLSPPDRMMSVEVTPGPVPRFSAPRELFRMGLERFDVMPDGQTFLGLRLADADANKPLTLVTSWPALLPD